MKPCRTAFGRYIRAARLGYHRVERLDAWMQVAAKGPPWLVHVTREASEMTAPPGKFYVVWWKSDGSEGEALSLSPALTRLLPADVPVRLRLNDAGERYNR